MFGDLEFGDEVLGGGLGVPGAPTIRRVQVPLVGEGRLRIWREGDLSSPVLAARVCLNGLRMGREAAPIESQPTGSPVVRAHQARTRHRIDIERLWLLPGGEAPRETQFRRGDRHVLQILFWDADLRQGWQRTYLGATPHQEDENGRGVMELAQTQSWRAERCHSLPAGTETDDPVLDDPAPVLLRHHPLGGRASVVLCDLSRGVSAEAASGWTLGFDPFVVALGDETTGTLLATGPVDPLPGGEPAGYRLLYGRAARAAAPVWQTIGTALPASWERFEIVRGDDRLLAIGWSPSGAFRIAPGSGSSLPPARATTGWFAAASGRRLAIHSLGTGREPWNDAATPPALQLSGNLLRLDTAARVPSRVELLLGASSSTVAGTTTEVDVSAHPSGTAFTVAYRYHLLPDGGRFLRTHAATLVKP